MTSGSRHVALERLFIDALGVLNRALDAHRGKVPYRQILAEAERLEGRRLGVLLYLEKPSDPAVFFAVRFRNGLLEPASVEQSVEGPIWKISVDRIKQIIVDEDRYVSDPEGLPWSWLTDQIEAANT